MRSLSCWAKHHPYKARLAIALSETMLFILAFKLGLLLLQAGIYVPGKAVAVPVLFLSAACLIASFKNIPVKWGLKLYWRQRVCFFLIGLSAFLLTTFMVSSEKLLTWNTYSSLSGSPSTILVKPAPVAARSLAAKKWNKALKLLLRKKREGVGLKILYIFLVLLGAVALLYLIAILSCSLACSGNEAGAWLVLVIGVGGIIFLCVWLVRKILKG